MEDALHSTAELDAIALPEQMTSLSGFPLNGLHLLVAEDNEMNQFLTQETLRRVGCTSEVVAEGALAVQAVATRQYDAVLMDCQMPGIDGLEATRRIREAEAAVAGSRRIPIIALTAEAIQGDREKCLAAGMDGYVSKPINPAELFSAIRSLMPAKRFTAATSGSTGSPVAPAPTGLPSAALASAPVETSDTGVPIDVESLLARCMRDADFACRMLRQFEQRALADVEKLRQGVAGGDADGVKRLAHNLKSVAAHVGAAQLRKIAFDIEQAGARHDMQFIEQQLAHLDEEARRCAAYVPDAVLRLAATGALADADK